MVSIVLATIFMISSPSTLLFVFLSSTEIGKATQSGSIPFFIHSVRNFLFPAAWDAQGLLVLLYHIRIILQQYLTGLREVLYKMTQFIFYILFTFQTSIKHLTKHMDLFKNI